MISIALILAALCNGEYRWHVKTSFPDSSAVVETTVEELSELPVPLHLGDKAKRAAAENKIVKVEAKVIGYKLEADLDIHVVILGDGGETMIIEFPDPRCVGDLAAKRRVALARRQFFAVLGKGKPFSKTIRYLPSPIPVVITGAIFFDKPHKQTGHARNYVELHPVEKIEKR